MTSFPIFISLEGKPCLIVGGGNVAARKCRGLLAFGADVTVIAKKVGLTADLHNTDKVTGHERASTRLHMTERSFRERDVTEKEWTLVIAATDDREVNSRVARLCHEREILPWALPHRGSRRGWLPPCERGWKQYCPNG